MQFVCDVLLKTTLSSSCFVKNQNHALTKKALHFLFDIFMRQQFHAVIPMQLKSCFIFKCAQMKKATFIKHLVGCTMHMTMEISKTSFQFVYAIFRIILNPAAWLDYGENTCWLRNRVEFPSTFLWDFLFIWNLCKKSLNHNSNFM